MKAGHLTRQLMSDEYKSRLKDAEFIFFASYKGISADGMREIRSKMRENLSSVMVVKNSLLRRVFEELKMQSLIDCVEEELAIVCGKEDPITVTKELQELTKKYEGFKVKAGFLENNILNQESIKRLAAIPSKEVLYAQVTSLIKSPLSNFVHALKGNLISLVNIFRQIKGKKES